MQRGGHRAGRAWSTAAPARRDRVCEPQAAQLKDAKQHTSSCVGVTSGREGPSLTQHALHTKNGCEVKQLHLVHAPVARVGTSTIRCLVLE